MKLRVLATVEFRGAQPDAPYFDVIDPPQHYADQHLGKELDQRQWREALDYIIGLGFVFDPTSKAFRRGMLLRRHANVNPPAPAVRPPMPPAPPTKKGQG